MENVFVKRITSVIPRHSSQFPVWLLRQIIGHRFREGRHHFARSVRFSCPSACASDAVGKSNSSFSKRGLNWLVVFVFETVNFTILRFPLPATMYADVQSLCNCSRDVLCHVCLCPLFSSYMVNVTTSFQPSHQDSYLFKCVSIFCASGL